MRVYNYFSAVFILLLIVKFPATAQRAGEAIVPLSSNPVLQKYPVAASHGPAFGKRAFGKRSSGLRFPFIDRFNYAGTEITDSLWDLKAVKKQGRSAVFNAKDQNNATYLNGSGAFTQTDVLLSRDIDITTSNGQLFVAFNYSTGTTWQSGDSLVLQMETPSSSYISIWRSPNTALSSTNVRINVPLQNYNSPTFNFRFICYTSATATNTETFLLHQVVFADKLELPAYENFNFFERDTFPSKVYWQQAQSKINTSTPRIDSLNTAVFNAYDEAGQVYNNANGQTGYADTLQAQPADLTQLQLNDSVYLRFYYRSMPAAGVNDSLILEFLNNVGAWIRVWQSGRTSQSNFSTYISQINIGRFRHQNFQFRLINKCTYRTNDSLQFIVTGFHIGRKLQLPFLDDFSYEGPYPSGKLWKDKYVYINNNFPIRPPSINVATFDGLDVKGNAYGLNATGYCDSLTSYPINLNGLKRSDSVYLSFFIQPKGLGDMPESGLTPPYDRDSLILEFRSRSTDKDAYKMVWSALASFYPADRFTQVFILVDSAFLQDDFQIRFKNQGSKTGNLDQWHLDYIRLDKGRTLSDGFQDIAITNTPSGLLNKYAAMPRRQYLVNPSIYTNTTQFLGIRNNYATTAFPVNFSREIFDPLGAQIDLFTNTQPNVQANSDTSVLINSATSLGGNFTGDSIVFQSKYKVNLNNNFDNIPGNDSCFIPTIFSNYFAYDDGSAEAGYGIEIESGAVALGFKLEAADSLQGISMFFNQSTADVSQQSFNLMVWSAIGTNGGGMGENVLKKILFSRPVYMNQRNGFFYYKFSEPLFLPAGSFYIGWEQLTPFQLNVGFDQNYQVNSKYAVNQDMYFRLRDNVWQKTALEGALMMRPIIGKWIDPPVGVVEHVRTSLDVLVYPNPASSYIYISAEGKNKLSAELFDLTGRTVLQQSVVEKELHLPALNEGLYLLKISEKETGRSTIKKIIIKY